MMLNLQAWILVSSKEQMIKSLLHCLTDILVNCQAQIWIRLSL